MTIQTRNLDGLEVAFELTGDGPQNVVVLHGWGGRIESMQQLAASLSIRGYHVHNLDLPGFGRSTMPPSIPTVWGVAEYTRFVADYAREAGLSRAHWIGHSFGGRICIVLGSEFPDLVDKIVLTSSAGVMSDKPQKKWYVALGNELLKLPGLRNYEEKVRQWGRDMAGSVDLRTAGLLEPIFRKVIVQDLLPFAANIKAPTLLIWGDQDQDTPLWQGRKLEATIPDAGLVVFEGASHFAYQERLPDFVRIVDTFFRGQG